MDENKKDTLMSAAASAVGSAYEAGYDDAAKVAYDAGYEDGLRRGSQEVLDLINLAPDSFDSGDPGPEGCGECSYCVAGEILQGDPQEFIADVLDFIAEADSWADTVEERLDLAEADSVLLVSLEERLAAVEAVTVKQDGACWCGDPDCPGI